MRKEREPVERTIQTIGKPSIDKLPKATAAVFYAELLSAALNYYRTEEKKGKENVEAQAES